jgi:hypothetical protein
MGAPAADQVKETARTAAVISLLLRCYPAVFSLLFDGAHDRI